MSASDENARRAQFNSIAKQDAARQAKIAAAKAGQVLPNSDGVTNTAPGRADVVMDLRTGTHRAPRP